MVKVSPRFLRTTCISYACNFYFFLAVELEPTREMMEVYHPFFHFPNTPGCTVSSQAKRICDFFQKRLGLWGGSAGGSICCTKLTTSVLSPEPMVEGGNWPPKSSSDIHICTMASMQHTHTHIHAHSCMHVHEQNWCLMVNLVGKMFVAYAWGSETDTQSYIKENVPGHDGVCL